MKNFLLWTLALIITLTAAVYQRATGPTHAARGKVTIGNAEYKYRLIRTHGGELDAPIHIQIPDHNVEGELIFKRYKVDEEWTTLKMQREGDILKAFLPHQPPAGKLEYYLRLRHEDEMLTVPADRDLVIRFKGAVPKVALYPHVLLMFIAMLFSTRAGLEALAKREKVRKYTFWATGLLFLGGMVMGPVVQKFAFGELWTGVPFGWDLTDNKTLIIMIGWIIAAIAVVKQKQVRTLVIGASVLLLLIYSIPHSMMGSELNYETGEVVSSGVGK